VSRIVFLCSPYRGDVEANVKYAQRAVRSCILRGEVPIAPHLMYPGAFDDNVELERWLGMSAGADLLLLSDVLIAFTDHGISQGMQWEISRAIAAGIAVEYRCLPPS
jgi:hypothetical protein